MVKSQVAGRLTLHVGVFSPLPQVQKSLPKFIPKHQARVFDLQVLAFDLSA